jgi:hypothetical protein
MRCIGCKRKKIKPWTGVKNPKNKTMDFNGNVKASESEHVKIATDMATHICGFNPTQQNEMLGIIRGVVSKSRQLQIDEAEKQLAYLKESIQGF